MSNLDRYQGGGLVPSRISRAVSRINAGADVEAAVINARAELEMVKLDGIAAITAQAMHKTAMVSQLEQTLGQTVPHASGRLAMLGDLSALAMADVVGSAARRIAR